MRELRHPWLLMHSQDRKSRRRCTKPRRQYVRAFGVSFSEVFLCKKELCELSGATSLLSLEYLFCHLHDLLKAIVGSLGLSFKSVSLAVWKTVRQAFAPTLYSRFPTRMSLSLGPIDTFSTGCHPSQTARLLLSSFELATIQKISSITLSLSFRLS